MRLSVRNILITAAGCGLLALPAAAANRNGQQTDAQAATSQGQDQGQAQGQDQDENPLNRPLSQKERWKQQRELRKELKGPYKQWLSQDVAYIITDQERKAFLSLSNDEERDAFIEQFWRRRNPDGLSR